MKRVILLLLLLSLGLNVGMIVKFRQRESTPWPEGKMNMDHAGRMRRMGEVLQLSPDQLSAMDRVHREMDEEFQGSRQQMYEMRQHLQETLLAEDLDLDLIRQLTARMAQSRGRLDSLITERLIRELPALTPEQRLEYMHRMPGEGRRHGRGPGKP